MLQKLSARHVLQIKKNGQLTPSRIYHFDDDFLKGFDVFVLNNYRFIEI